jgi:hypothetical protein
MPKDKWEIKLERKIRHHRNMRWKYWDDPEELDYHKKFMIATEKELDEYKKEKLNAKKDYGNQE